MTTVFQQRTGSTAARELGEKCESCRGVGIRPYHERQGQKGSFCIDCDGVGYLGVDPYEPSADVAGSIERVARYRAGMPLWDPFDFRPAEADQPAEAEGCQFSIVSEEEEAEEEE